MIVFEKALKESLYIDNWKSGGRFTKASGGRGIFSEIELMTYMYGIAITYGVVSLLLLVWFMYRVLK